MIIDTKVRIIPEERAIIPSKYLNTNKMITISINGLMAFDENDTETILYNKITMKEECEIDYTNDQIVIMYEGI